LDSFHSGVNVYFFFLLNRDLDFTGLVDGLHQSVHYFSARSNSSLILPMKVYLERNHAAQAHRHSSSQI
jgi:hypothetical protein